MGLLLMLLAAVIFITAYHTYGRWIARKFKIDFNKKTPAHEHRDGVDFEPAKRYVLLGHHFASIAGVGPIVGPIAGAMFGWLPVFLWIIIGNIFMGAVHDFASLVVSVRNGGKSIGGLMEEYLGKAGKRVFLVFTWLALILIIAVFTIV
ncbi:MAG TPA: carbon starvation CstA family protein, partial [Candidatus Goldiibacteriota bacterium]|nr:carbon starvation CstA family protein [Candidatus Goldiibacteriota bacterium]HPN64493.1 carbon starvation CstA family protein [Candidatus Goldiibacteriota bacterium]